MASVKSPIKPARSDGYPGIIFYTFAIMCAAVGLIAYEVHEEYNNQVEFAPTNYPKPKSAPLRGAPNATTDPAAPPPAK